MGFTTSFAVRLIFSGILVIFLIGLSFSVYGAFFSSPKNADWNADNTFDELMNLINAQKGDAWELKTFVALPAGFVIMGFGEENNAKVLYPQQIVDKPARCSGACMCLFKMEYDRESGPRYALREPTRCEPLAARSVTQIQGENRLEGFYIASAVTHTYKVQFVDKRLDISLLTGRIPLGDGVGDDILSCDVARVCCSVVKDSESCKNRNFGTVVDVITQGGSTTAIICRQTENKGECELASQTYRD